MPGAPEATPELDEAVRLHAREILARPEFAPGGEPPELLAALLERVAAALRRVADGMPEWLVESLRDALAVAERLFGWAVGSSGEDAGLTLTQWLVGGAVLVGLAALFVWGLRRLGRPARAEFGPARAGSAGPGLLRRAQELATRGEHLDAAHHVQLAVLELLIERNWIELERSDPNRVLRRRLSATKLPVSERRALLGLVDRLERRWFRDRAEDPELYRDWREAHERLAALGGIS